MSQIKKNYTKVKMLLTSALILPTGPCLKIQNKNQLKIEIHTQKILILIYRQNFPANFFNKT